LDFWGVGAQVEEMATFSRDDVDELDLNGVKRTPIDNDDDNGCAWRWGTYSSTKSNGQDGRYHDVYTTRLVHYSLRNKVD
jgi:hypothetical protein